MTAAPRPLRTITYVVAGALFVLWLAYLLFQTGSPWDETEHAHAAWLISQGKRPLDDFFQHHQPLLWHVLSVYYRLGFTGAGVLFWGRTIVALSGVISVASLLSLGHTTQGDGARLAGIAGAGFLVALTFLLQELFVLRPETLSTAFMLVALALWSMQPSRTLRVVVAGALIGAACYSSPRFLLLGGLFLLIGENSVRRWGWLVLGGLSFLAIYTVVSGFSLTKVLFNLQFSSFLQTVGDAEYGASRKMWWTLAALVILPMLPLLLTLKPSDRTRGALLVVYLMGIFVLCQRLAGMFRYQQAYAPFVTCVPVVVTWLVARFNGVHDRKTIIAGFASIGFLIVATYGFQRGFLMPRFQLFELVRVRDSLAAMIPPGRTVLVYTEQHPITVADTSYYGSPLADAQDRLCRAVRGFKTSIPLPHCDFMQEYKMGRPYLLDWAIARALSPADVEAFAQSAHEHYVQLPLRSDILVERSAATAHLRPAGSP